MGQHLGEQWPGSGSRDYKSLNRHNFLKMCMNRANEVFTGM